jgi:hypothetical protein
VHGDINAAFRVVVAWPWAEMRHRIFQFRWPGHATARPLHRVLMRGALEATRDR